MVGGSFKLIMSDTDDSSKASLFEWRRIECRRCLVTPGWFGPCQDAAVLFRKAQASSRSFDRPLLIQRRDCIIAEECMINISSRTCDPVRICVTF